MFNLFSTNVPLLYPLKNIRKPEVFDVFRGYRNGGLIKNGLNAKVAKETF